MSGWRQDLDRRSFALGVATAFCECVAAECKKCAFSAPLTPGECAEQREAMEQIAAEHGLQIYYEESLDLPEPDRLCWYAFYKYDEVLEEYLALRAEGLHPITDLNPFFGVLSYGIAFGRDNANEPDHPEEEHHA